jgi:hypothetical protein
LKLCDLLLLAELRRLFHRFYLLDITARRALLTRRLGTVARGYSG